MPGTVVEDTQIVSLTWLNETEEKKGQVHLLTGDTLKQGCL